MRDNQIRYAIFKTLSSQLPPRQLSQLLPAGFNNEESRFYVRVISRFRTGRDGYYFPAFFDSTERTVESIASDQIHNQVGIPHLLLKFCLLVIDHFAGTQRSDKPDVRLRNRARNECTFPSGLEAPYPAGATVDQYLLAGC
jgi:hypothetical protein